MLQDALPERAGELTTSQRAFLHQLADRLPGVVWEDSALQTAVFDVARLTPIAPAQAFKALYRVLLDRDSGPKAGNLLAFLDQDFLLKRLRDPKLAAMTNRNSGGRPAITREEFRCLDWLEHREHIANNSPPKAKLAKGWVQSYKAFDEGEVSACRPGYIVEYTVAFDDNKTHTCGASCWESLPNRQPLTRRAEAYSR